jgi:hypothetical protein
MSKSVFARQRQADMPEVRDTNREERERRKPYFSATTTHFFSVDLKVALIFVG